MTDDGTYPDANGRVVLLDERQESLEAFWDEIAIVSGVRPARFDVTIDYLVFL